MSKREAVGRIFGRAPGSGHSDSIQVEILVLDASMREAIEDSTPASQISSLLSGVGFEIGRVTLLRAEKMQVTREVAAALVREPAVLVTLGGLGDDPSDCALEAVAMAGGRPMVEDPAVAAFVESARVMWPDGSAPVPNQLGGPAGAVIDLGTTVVVALPARALDIESMWHSGVADVLDMRFRDKLPKPSGPDADLPMDN